MLYRQDATGYEQLGCRFHIFGVPTLYLRGTVSSYPFGR